MFALAEKVYHPKQGAINAKELKMSIMEMFKEVLNTSSTMTENQVFCQARFAQNVSQHSKTIIVVKIKKKM